MKKVWIAQVELFDYTMRVFDVTKGQAKKKLKAKIRSWLESDESRRVTSMLTVEQIVEAMELHELELGGLYLDDCFDGPR